MRQFDRPARSATPDLNRLGGPATLVCAALMLAVIMLAMRIVSTW